MDRREDAERAIETLHNTYFEGHQISVMMVSMTTWFTLGISI